MKKTIYSKIALVGLLLSTSLIVNAKDRPHVFGKPIQQKQNETGLIRCVSTEYAEYLRSQGQLESREEFEAIIAQNILERRALRMASPSETTEIITIPVVVHVIHNGDAIGVNENISDAQVLSQITVLNQDYRRMVGTPGFNNDPVGADVEIQFCLAKTDPNNNPTTGIDRQNKGVASWGENQIETTLKPSTSWNPSKYFNIWVVNFGGNLTGVLGYAQFPNASGLPGMNASNGSSSTDGVVIGYQYFGSSQIASGSYQTPYNLGRTASHEIGHALGLIHIWGDTVGCSTIASQGDYCDDTPIAYEENDQCPQGYDSCPTQPGVDMTNNYMDYTRDACMNIFTQDQKERMLTVMNVSSRRAALKTSTVCSPPLGMDDFNLLNGLNVYPNPTQGILNISSDNGDLPDSFTIYNSLGQVMANIKVSSTSNLNVNTSTYANGLYFIKLDKGNQSKTIKFIKN